MPRARPVECSRFMLLAGGNMKHHGASPWHLANRRISLFCSCEHETPQGQPVVSAEASVHHLCFTYFLLAHWAFRFSIHHFPIVIFYPAQWCLTGRLRSFQ